MLVLGGKYLYLYLITGADFSIYLTIILDVAKRNKQNWSLALHIFFFLANLHTNQPSRYKQSVKGR